MNPRKRKLVRDGRMEKMIEEENSVPKLAQPDLPKVEKKENLLVEEPVIKHESKQKAIDAFIAKELEENERIPSSKKKITTKKKTTKKVTKKKTGDK